MVESKVSPLSPYEELKFNSFHPLQNHLSRLDKFFEMLYGQPRTQWKYIIETYLYLPLAKKDVSDAVAPKWVDWLFPLMLPPSDSAELMDKEKERLLFNLLLATVSAVLHRQFMDEKVRIALFRHFSPLLLILFPVLPSFCLLSLLDN
jgi:hypothetical protein